jgi:hypothetical protein
VARGERQGARYKRPEARNEGCVVIVDKIIEKRDGEGRI